jgi:hypothetical protein
MIDVRGVGGAFSPPLTHSGSVCGAGEMDMQKEPTLSSRYSARMRDQAFKQIV